MQIWKLIGVGLLISALMRGCPDTEKQSSSNITEKDQLRSSHVSDIPSIAREASSRVVQQESETSFEVPFVQANVPVGGEVHKSLINQESDQRAQRATASPLELPNLETERRPALANTSEPLSESSLNPVLRGDITTHEENVTLQNHPLSSPVVSSSSESISGGCRLASEPIDPFIESTVQSDTINPFLDTPLSESSLNPTLRSDTNTNEESVALQDQPLFTPVLSSHSESSSERCNHLEPLSEKSPLRSDTTTNEESAALQDQSLSTPVLSSRSEGSSERCKYPWELDSAGNRCGDRAASERPNLSTVNTIDSYSAPIPSYYIPTSGYGSTYVRGYFRKDGTYVRGHYRRSR